MKKTEFKNLINNKRLVLCLVAIALLSLLSLLIVNDWFFAKQKPRDKQIIFKRQFFVAEENFADKFNFIKNNKELIRDIIFSQINIHPLWLPPTKYIFDIANGEIIQLNKTIKFLFRNEMGFYSVSIKKSGEIICEVKSAFYDIDALWQPGSRYTLKDKYELGWVRYINEYKTKKILRQLEKIISISILPKSPQSAQKPKQAVIKNPSSGEIISIDPEIESIFLELSGIDQNPDSSLFLRVIICDAELGLVSKLISVKIKNDGVCAVIPMDAETVIIEKIFSVSDEGQSIYRNTLNLPIVISSQKQPKSLNQYEQMIKMVNKKSGLMPFSKMPRAFIGTMGEHTDIPFAAVSGDRVYHSDNGIGAGTLFNREIVDIVLRKSFINAVELGDVIVQLGCSFATPDELVRWFKKTARVCLEANIDAIEINMCGIAPTGYGAYLMLDKQLAYDIVRAVALIVKKELPVIVKIRTGVNSENKNAVDIARAVQEAGATAIIVLAQTAEKSFATPFDYETVRAVKEAVNIPVFVNGGIDSPITAKQVMQLTKADGVVVGRAAIFDPSIIKRINYYLEQGELLKQPSVVELLAMARKHFFLAKHFYGEGFNLDRYLKHFMCGYLHAIAPELSMQDRYYVLYSLMNMKADAQLVLLFDYMDYKMQSVKTSANKYYYSDKKTAQY